MNPPDPTLPSRAETTASLPALRPVSATSRPTWSGAIWIGELDDSQAPLLADGSTDRGLLSLESADGFARARLLIRSGRLTRGFVQLDLRDGALDSQLLAAAVAALPQPVPAPAGFSRPAMTVAICTRARPDSLRTALRQVVRTDYPHLEILVVDNGPEDPRTAAVVAEFGDDPRVRRIEAPVPGLARARNVALLAARHDLVAFTDDDVLVDPGWLQGLADGFNRRDRVACVTGIVPTMEITAPAEWYFDSRVNWATSCAPDVFCADQHRPGEPLFPFRVGRYGTGANFAVDRRAIVALGGFDEGFGVGSPTGGGEDIDMFVRVLLAGHALAYEPASVVWHRHRSDMDGLRRQISDYGVGLGAWLTKLLTQRRTVTLVARRAIPALAHLARITRVAGPGDGTAPVADDGPSPVDRQTAALFVDVGRIERSGIRRGPRALWSARRSGAQATPLLAAVLPSGSESTEDRA